MNQVIKPCESGGIAGDIVDEFKAVHVHIPWWSCRMNIVNAESYDVDEKERQ